MTMELMRWLETYSSDVGDDTRCHVIVDPAIRHQVTLYNACIPRLHHLLSSVEIRMLAGSALWHPAWTLDFNLDALYPQVGPSCILLPSLLQAGTQIFIYVHVHAYSVFTSTRTINDLNQIKQLYEYFTIKR